MINRNLLSGVKLQREDHSPIASRTRRSLSLSNEKTEVPTKRRRRSSVKRKSLVETLESVSRSAGGLLIESPPIDHKSQSGDSGCSTSSSKVINTGRDTSQQLTRAQELQSGAKTPSPAVDASKQSSNDEESEEFKFVQDWFSSLQLEASDWNSLLLHYKGSGEESNTELLTPGIIESSPENFTASSINYEEFANEITALEQMFSVAHTTVSSCLNRVHDIRLKQEAWMKRFMKKESEAWLAESMASDPKVLIEDIFKCDILLEDCSVLNSSVT